MKALIAMITLSAGWGFVVDAIVDGINLWGFLLSVVGGVIIAIFVTAVEHAWNS